MFEMLPVPLTLHSAAVPRIYEEVAAAPDHLRLLEIPFGVRDGTTSVGNFSARSQFYQTTHGKALIGGYLSRLAWGRLSELRGHPVLNTLTVLSEGGELPPGGEDTFLKRAPGFISQSMIGFVVIDRARASDKLRALAVRGFRLEHLQTDGELELYRPSDGNGAVPADVASLP
jgi:hypothetical protein